MHVYTKNQWITNRYDSVADYRRLHRPYEKRITYAEAKSRVGMYISHPLLPVIRQWGVTHVAPRAGKYNTAQRKAATYYFDRSATSRVDAVYSAAAAPIYPHRYQYSDGNIEYTYTDQQTGCEVVALVRYDIERGKWVAWTGKETHEIKVFGSQGAAERYTADIAHRTLTKARRNAGLYVRVTVDLSTDGIPF